MSCRRHLLPTIAAALLFGAGCVEFNQECTPLVSEPDAVTGYLDGEVSITKPAARTKNNSLGQLVAEAYYFAFEDYKPEERPDLAVENSGGIRFESPCEIRESLRKGAVKRRHLREVVPFDNNVEIVEMSYKQLKGMFEHSVAAFTSAGQANPSGAFLQVHGVEVWVDCSKPAEALGPDGARVKDGERVTRMVIHRRDVSALELPISEPLAMEQGKVRVATNSYLAGGGDGYLDFEEGEAVASAGTYGFELIAGYFKKTYPESSPLPSAAPERVHLSPECR